MPSCALRLLSVAVCLAAAAPPARAVEPTVKKRLALILYEKGSPDRTIVRAFRTALAAIDDRAAGLAILGERELDERVGPAHIDAAVACGADLRCVADIGDQAGATHVLFGRIAAEKGGVGMQWLLIEVRKAAIVGKIKLRPTDAAAAKAGAEKLASDVLGVDAAELGAPATRSAPRDGGEPRAVAAAKATPDPPASWSAPRVGGGVALVAGALALGAGVLASRDGTDGADALLAAGGALAIGGAALWAWDRLRVTPVVGVEARGGYAGVALAW